MGNYIQYLLITYDGKESEKKMCNNHFAVHLKLTQYYKSIILQLKNRNLPLQASVSSPVKLLFWTVFFLKIVLRNKLP